jgi:hypothetical protein
MASSNAAYDEAAAAHLYQVVASNATLDEVRAALEACSPRGGPTTRGKAVIIAAASTASSRRATEVAGRRRCMPLAASSAAT